MRSPVRIWVAAPTRSLGITAIPRDFSMRGKVSRVFPLLPENPLIPVKLDMGLGQSIINSGVMLMNLDRLQKEQDCWTRSGPAGDIIFIQRYRKIKSLLFQGRHGNVRSFAKGCIFVRSQRIPAYS